MTTTPVRRSTKLLRAARTVLLVLLGCVLMLRFVENYLIFFPRAEPYVSWEPPTPGGRNVEFAADDGTKLTGWYLPHAEAQAVVLFCCGNGGNMSYWRDAFRTLHRRCRVTIMGFNYRGYGGSEGSPSEHGVLDDARAARRWLCDQQGIPPERIVLMGRSLGGGVAIDLAADGARGLVVESTFTSLPDMAGIVYPYLPFRWLMRTQFHSLEKIADYRNPLLVSHGDADELVPYRMGQRLFDAAGSNVKRFYTVPGGEHNDPQPHDYYDVLDRFLAELP
jgi:fermentation-respiration switch protein FrsA (DUF1100 family)